MSVKTINNANFSEETQKGTVLLDFWAPWCGPCRMVGPILEELSEEMPDLTVGKVNVDEENELARQFGVMNIPTLVILKDGQSVAKSVGARPKDALRQWIESAK